jgi:two-component system response regulator YesN
MPMKILIVDDESLARSTLRSMLQELQLPLEVLEEATNGEEMVALVQRYTPDIVFVDIKMPKLNGLEAIKQAKAFAPDARWFILTGFSEFTYAQEALRIGVSDYLLKPVDPAEVGKAITEVIREQKKRLLVLNKQFERDLAAIYHGLSSIKQEDPDSLLMKARFIGAIFYSDSFLMEAEKAQRQSDFLRDVQVAVNTVLADKIRIALFALPSGEIALIGAWRAEHEAQGVQLCRRCLQLIEGILPHYYDHTFCVTMLQTAVCGSYDELYERLNWLQKFSALRSVYGIGKKIHIKELSHYAAQPHLVEISRLLEKLSFYYREKMYVHYMDTIDNIVSRFIAGNAFSDERAIDYGTKKGAVKFLCHTLPCQITPEQDGAEWKWILHACGEQRLLAQPKKDQGDMIAQVILFIEQNYQSDISITQIAERLQVTPNYLSALFHKKIGITFIKYLTKIRLLRAKELLADPEMRVQQVAELVGYTSTRHFTKIFTSSFGYYPSEQHKKSQ